MVVLALSPLLVLAIVFWRTEPDFQEPSQEQAEVRPVPPPEPPPVKPVEHRELPITGRIFDESLKPAEGLAVRCGDETAISETDGSFRFSPALRTGSRAVSVHRGAQELIRWDDVVTGAIPSGGDEEVPSWSGMVAINPTMVRWTINLGPGLPIEQKGTEKVPLRGDRFADARGVLIQEWGSGGEVRIHGVAALPDGAHIDATLYFEEERLVSSIERAEVQNGLFSAVIRFPDDFRLHSAVYQLHLLFGISLEDPRDVEQWKRKHPELDWDRMNELESIREIFAGDPTNELEENRQVERHYREMLDSIDRLKNILVSRARRARYLARRWDPEILQAEVEIQQGSLSGSLLAPSGEFDFQAWRRFLDDGWRQEVHRLLEDHDRKKQGKFRRADFLLESVLKRLLLISKIESILVYQAWGREIDGKDFYLDEERPEGDEHIMLTILNKDLSLLQRFRNLTDGEKAEDRDQSSK